MTRRDPRRYLLTGGTAVTADGRSLIVPDQGEPTLLRRRPLRRYAPGVKVDTDSLDRLVVEALLAVADKTDFKRAESEAPDDTELRKIESQADVCGRERPGRDHGEGMGCDPRPADRAAREGEAERRHPGAADPRRYPRCRVRCAKCGRHCRSPTSATSSGS